MKMTWGLRFLVKWANIMLGFQASYSQVVLKVSLGRKTTRKVRAVEVPFGGSKRKISSGAPKWAIQVEILLSDFFKTNKRGLSSALGAKGSDLPFVASM